MISAGEHFVFWTAMNIDTDHNLSTIQAMVDEL